MHMNNYRRQFLYNLNQFIHTYYIFLEPHGSKKDFALATTTATAWTIRILNIGAFVCFGAPI